MNFDEIRLSLGIGDFEFGMTKIAIISLIGDGYIESIDEDGDTQIEYEKLALRFTFWKDYDFRLGIISTERSEATLCGECLFSKSKQELRNFIENKLNSVISKEDGCIHEDGSIQEWIDVDEKNVSFWFLNDKLYLIDCFCAWTDHDTPKWPQSQT